MTHEEIDKAVKERLRIANERLSAKNGVDPNNKSYQKKKQDIIYAWEHGITYKEVNMHRKGEWTPKQVTHPTVQEVERRLGRPIRTQKPHALTGAGYAVRNVITRERYRSVRDVAKRYKMAYETVMKYIDTKRMFKDNTYFEYEK